MNIEEELKKWDEVDCVKFALWCVKKCQHLNNGELVKDAIEVAKKWLKNPTRENTTYTAYVYATYTAYIYVDYAAHALETTKEELFNEYIEKAKLK